jgi:superoxide dismutase
MKANGGGGDPGGALTDKTEADFGSFDAFKAQFTEAAKHVDCKYKEKCQVEEGRQV